MQFADTHCHLDFPQFDHSRKCLLDECLDASIELIVVPAVKRTTWPAVLALAKEFDQVRPALGLHPYFMSDHQESHLEDLVHFLAHQDLSEVCAVGEIGLDATIDDTDRQRFFFEQQLEIAEQFQRPVIIHSRKTHSQVVKTLKRYQLTGGVVHAFSGSAEEAKAFVSAGLAIGVGGVITWPRASKTRKAVSLVPLESLVLETDAPDMPVSDLGKRRGKGTRGKGTGTPLNVLRVFESLCEIRSETPEAIATTLWANSRHLFCHC